MIKLVIFDLDGTITQPHLDFRKIREEMGITVEKMSILDFLDSLDGEEKRRADAILDAHEKDAAYKSKLSSGARELFDYLREKNIRIAIMTRNARENVLIVLEKHKLSVDEILTREDGPVKPSPEGVFALCGKFDVTPGETLMAGDFLFDIQTGKNAGTRTILLKWQDTTGWPVQADYEVSTLAEIIPIIEKLNE